MHFRFFHVFSWLNNSALFSTKCFSIFNWMFISSPTEQHFGGLQVWTIINRAAIWVQLFVWHKTSTSLGKFQGEKLLDHTVKLCLVLSETAKLSSKMAVPLCIPNNEFLLLYNLASIWYCQCSEFLPFLQGCSGILTLNYIMTYDVEYVFIRSLPTIYHLGKVCVQVFGPSFSWVFHFLVLSLIVHTFWIAVLYHSLMDHCLVVVKGLA